MDSPGVVRAKKIEKIGMWASDTAQLWFEDVRVPKKNIIGEEGKGFMYQMIQFQQERIFAIAAGITPMQQVLKDTIEVNVQIHCFRLNPEAADKSHSSELQSAS